jgi:hypothetical protein
LTYIIIIIIIIILEGMTILSRSFIYEEIMLKLFDKNVNVSTVSGLVTCRILIHFLQVLQNSKQLVGGAD